MNIIIVGYGKMGIEIEAIATSRGHTIRYRVDPSGTFSGRSADYAHMEDIPKDLQDVDVAIEFSLPKAVEDNAKIYAQHNISAVVGTTGWASEEKHIKAIVEHANIGYLYGSNFSVGAHVFMHIAEFAAKIIEHIPAYDIGLWEIHHNKKKDCPSGTALSTAHRILKVLTRKTTVESKLPSDETIAPHILPVVGQRLGSNPGFHELIMDSPFDTITINHQARTRSGFALGAVIAAEWLEQHKRKGFIHVDTFIEDWMHNTL